MQQTTCNDLPYCKDKIKRLNLKGKRKRNLIKKAIELSKMLDMDTLIVFRDIDTGKITQYNSGQGGIGRPLFTLEDAQIEIKKWKAKGRQVQRFDDTDYAKLKLVKNSAGNEDLDGDDDELPQDNVILGKRDANSKE